MLQSISRNNKDCAVPQLSVSPLPLEQHARKHDHLVRLPCMLMREFSQDPRRQKLGFSNCVDDERHHPST
eukprot:COSAG06_NODE_56_length_27627_cov_106.527136_11_plen_70_part_00